MPVQHSTRWLARPGPKCLHNLRRLTRSKYAFVRPYVGLTLTKSFPSLINNVLDWFACPGAIISSHLCARARHRYTPSTGKGHFSTIQSKPLKRHKLIPPKRPNGKVIKKSFKLSSGSLFRKKLTHFVILPHNYHLVRNSINKVEHEQEQRSTQKRYHISTVSITKALPSMNLACNRP